MVAPLSARPVEPVALDGISTRRSVTSDGLLQLIEVKNPFIRHVLDGPRIDVIGDIAELAGSRG